MRSYRLSEISTGTEFLLVLVLAGIARGGLVHNTLETGENLFTADPLLVLGAGSAGAFAAGFLESPEGHRDFLPRTPFHTLDRADDLLFGPVLPLSSAGVWLTGILAGEPSLENTGEDLCRGLLYTYGLTLGLKRVTGRTRPDGSDRRSFPSGHAAGAACAAAVLWTDHGATAGIPAASIALYTCLSRVNLGRHYPSDVIIGAAIGVACGIAAAGIGDAGGEPGFSLSVSMDSQGRIHPGLW